MKKLKLKDGTWRYQIDFDHVVLFTPKGVRKVVDAQEILGARRARLDVNAVNKWIQENVIM